MYPELFLLFFFFNSLCCNTRSVIYSSNSISNLELNYERRCRHSRWAEAPQTLWWKVVHFNLRRHKQICGKWFFLVALLFVAPQTRSFERTLTLKIEADRAPEMLVSFYQDVRCHDPEESSLTYRYTPEGAFS